MDGNVYRVLARHFGIAAPVGTAQAKKEFTTLAGQLLPEGEASAFNQGMMDFGALQCTPVRPGCLTCPLQASCQAYRTGRVQLLPVKKAPVKVQERRFSYIYLRCEGHTAIRRRGPGDIWQGLYEPLLGELAADTSEAKLRLLRHGVKHQLTHRTLICDFYLWESDSRPALPEGYFWIKETELDRYAKPRLVEMLLEAVAKASGAKTP